MPDRAESERVVVACYRCRKHQFFQSCCRFCGCDLPDPSLWPQRLIDGFPVKADEVFGADYCHVPYWFCEVHRGVADDAEFICDRAFKLTAPTPCHLFQLGYQSARIDGQA